MTEIKIICPKCGNVAQSVQTKYGIRSNCCDLWSWGKAPLTDAKTHKARRLAHEAFDPIWKSKKLSRSGAYRWLAKKLKIPGELCHMKFMDAEMAYDVVDICRKFKRKGKKKRGKHRKHRNGWERKKDYA